MATEELEIKDIPAASGSYDPTGKVIMIHDLGASKDASTVLIDARLVGWQPPSGTTGYVLVKTANGYALAERGADVTPFAPASAGNWLVGPTMVKGALDELASRAAAAAPRIADQKTITASYTIVEADIGRQLVYNGGSNIVITVPTGLATTAGTKGLGFIVGIICLGTGQATFSAASGVDLRNENSKFTTKQYRPATLEGFGNNLFLTFNTPNA